MREEPERFAALASGIRERRKRLGLTQVALARDARIDRSYLSSLEGGSARSFPKAGTLRRLAKALRCEPAQLTGESAEPIPTTPYDQNPAYRRLVDALERLPAADRAQVLSFMDWIAEKTVRPESASKIDPRAKPNASTIRIRLADESAGRVAKRGAKVAEFNPKHQAPRLRSAATPNQALFYEGDEERPEREIPTHYWELGARLVRKVEGDSMKDVQISSRDLVFVRPTPFIKDGVDRIVVAEVDGSEYIKILRVRGDHIELESANERYGPMVINEDDDKFKMIGVVVGRSGYPNMDGFDPGKGAPKRRDGGDDRPNWTPPHERPEDDK